MLGNDSTLPTAHYTAGLEESCVKNTGEKGPGRVRTAQNTHIGRLKRRKRILNEYLIPDEMDTLFRVIDDPRDPAIPRLAYHHRLRESEVGMAPVKDWRRGRALDLNGLSSAD